MAIATPALVTPDAPRRAFFFRSAGVVWIGNLAGLVVLGVSPVIYLVGTSFTAEKTGEFTFANYAAAYGRARYVDALMNSLKLGGASALLAGVFAVPLAWAVARTDMPGRGFTRVMVL